MQAGPLFNNHEYNAYFYSVSPSYTTASRSTYEARGAAVTWIIGESSQRRDADE